MSQFSPLLDSTGNICTFQLSQELSEALEFDVKYKKTDNMKKRAVRTAGSYDEFRQLVAAAHLNKVSRKEVESLSQVKKGWKKGAVSSTKGSLLDLGEEESEKNSSRATIEGTSTSTLDPRTYVELENILRRFSSDAERAKYLIDLSLSRVSILLERAPDIELLETVWRSLCAHFYSRTSAAEKVFLFEFVSWLEALTSHQQFEMLLRMVPRLIIDNTITILQTWNDTLCENHMEESMTRVMNRIVFERPAYPRSQFYGNECDQEDEVEEEFESEDENV